MKRLQRITPHENGFPVSLDELKLPPSQLDPTYSENINNHHIFHYARTFARFAILQTLRDLDSSQTQTERDTHNNYHKLYLPAPAPSLYDAMEHIEEAVENDVQLRYGSANNFRHVRITPALMRKLMVEYDMTRQDKRQVHIA